MALAAILIALAFEQSVSSPWRAEILRAYGRLADRVERHFNAGEYRHGVVGACLVVVPPVIVAGLVYYALSALHPLAGLAWNALVLFFTMGFRQFSDAFGEIGHALRTDDIDKARTLLARWRGDPDVDVRGEEIARLAIEQGLLDSHRHVFATLFWFLVLPGPCGAVLYQAGAVVARRWCVEPGSPEAASRVMFSRFIGQFLHAVDWIPLRLTAMSFAVVGDFEDAIYCWRTQAREWNPIGEGIVLASGAGALGVRLGEPLRDLAGGVRFRPEIGLGEQADGQLMPSAVGLVWRALALWLIVVLLVLIASWAG